MKKRRGLALLLAVSMLIATAGEAYAADVGTAQTRETIVITEAHDSDVEDTQEEIGDEASTEENVLMTSDTETVSETVIVSDGAETDAEYDELYANDTSEDGIMTLADVSWLPTPTRTVSSASDFPVTLSNGDVLQIDGSLDYTAPTGESPIYVPQGASVNIIINGDVTLRGADASGATGATAAIRVSEGGWVTILSAHDVELSKSKDAAKDTLTLYGGNAAAGEDGKDGVKTSTGGANGYAGYGYTWTTGRGGNGGGGAAAALGGNGGNGGVSSANVTNGPQWQFFMGAGDASLSDSTGVSGDAGVQGASGERAGQIYLSGRLNFYATGGSAAAGGNGGSGSEGYAYVGDNRTAVGGAGGGGGGGGGCAAPAIGAGGAGGSSGGNGGQGGYDSNGNFIGAGTNVQGPGGGGGAGGWPNGGGGGGGAGTCSKAEKDGGTPGDGGAGGAAGASGMAGNAGTSTHIETQGGEPGHGANGVSDTYDASNGASGGTGGIENDNKFNGGSGGKGGAPVKSTSWDVASRLLICTAMNLNTYSWGNGGGEAQEASGQPYQLLDAMDCEFTLSGYDFTSRQNWMFKPSVLRYTYNASTDRDGKVLLNSVEGDGASDAQISYGKNTCYPTGTVTVNGMSSDKRLDKPYSYEYMKTFVGSQTIRFNINKGTVTGTNMTADKSTLISGEQVTLKFDKIYFGDSDSMNAKYMHIESTGKQGVPQVTWSVVQGSGELSGDGCSATFKATSPGEIKIRATLSDMQDLNDYNAEITLTSITNPLQASIMPETPHVLKTAKVVLPQQMSADKCTFQWYASGELIEGATEISYTPTRENIGKLLSVKVESTDDTVFFNENVTAKYVVADHTYSEKGFCKVCDWYQPATLSGDTYQIGNAGQLFWMASYVNGDSTQAELPGTYTSSKCVLTADIDLESRAWQPMSLYKGEFDGQTHTIKNLNIESSDEAIGLIGKTSGAQLKNLTLTGDIKATEGNKYVGGLVGYISGGSVSNVTSKLDIINESSTNVNTGGVVGYSQVSLTDVTSEALITNDGTNSNGIGGIAGYIEGTSITNANSSASIVNNGSANQGIGGIVGCANGTTMNTITSDAKMENNQTSSKGFGGVVGFVYPVSNLSNITSRASLVNKGTMRDGVGGIIGCIEGGTAVKYVNLSNFTSEAQISDENGASFVEGTGIGGVIGWSNYSKMENGTSRALIECSTPMNKCFVGGITGIGDRSSDISKCIFNGNINVSGEEVAIGGLLGGACRGSDKSSRLWMCANYGSVRGGGNKSSQGGLIGLLDDGATLVINCYNYGSVLGNSTYVGGFLGQAKKYNPNWFKNNCYLNTSSRKAIGAISGSEDTSTWCYVKTAKQFASGEVCSILNTPTSGKTPTWRQDIDNGQTPYDSYPVFEGGVVYALSDGTYSNSPEKISVEISWGTMAFKYEPGEWSAEDHSYSGGWTPATTDANLISVKNDSNVTLAVNASFEASEALAPYELTGSFEGMTSGKKNVAKGTTLQTRLLLNSLKPDSLEDQGNQSLGQVTVSLTTLKGGGN